MKKYRFLITLSLAVILAAFCVLVLPTRVEAETEGDYEYRLLVDKVTITGYNGPGGDVIVPSTLGGYPVYAIHQRVFSFNEKLTSVTIPDTVTIIGEEVFAGSDNLTTVTIGSGVTKICEGAFYACEGLTTITIPDNVITIDQNAFYNCYRLSSVTIGDGVTTIGSYAFYSCDNLTSVTLGDSVAVIGTAAFEYCFNLAEITIPESVSSVRALAFSECSKLRFNSYGNAKYLGSENNPYYVLVEAESTDITSCQIHNDTQVVARDAFKDCSDLTYSSYENAKYLGNSNNPYYLLVKVESEDIVSLRIHDDTRIILHDAISSCYELVSVKIGDSVKNIGEYAFDGCLKLRTVVFPDNVTDIGAYAFRSCFELTWLTLPDSVDYIGYRAFFYNYWLKDIYYSGSKSQWESICIDPENDHLRQATVYYNCKINGACGDNLTWALDENGTLYIFGAGDMDDYYSNPSGWTAPWSAYAGRITRVIIRNGVTNIGEEAFNGLTMLTDVDLGGTVQTIKYGAFGGGGLLKSLTIPASVSCLEDEFCLVSNRLDIIVEESSPYFCNDVSGVLYSKDMTKLVLAPLALSGTYRVPDSVKTIGNDAFAYCTELTGITLPENLESLGRSAFHHCAGLENVVLTGTLTEIQASAFSGTGLKQITIPASVTVIEGEAFYLCKNLTDVYYGGTAAQWDAITVFRDNEALLNATKHFTEHVHSYQTVVTAPACTAQGFTTHTCACSHSYKDTYVASLGHSFTNYKSDNNATYEKDGTKTAKCDRCNVTNTVTDPGTKLVRNGWFQIGGKWYYYKNNVKQTGWQQLGGIWYYFNPSGAMVTGWQRLGGVWYYFGTSGAMQTGWLQSGGVWYYFHGTGAMATGWVQSGGVWYYFHSSGAMATGWVQSGGVWYYFKSSGAMQTGWLYQGGVWYYFHSSGAMATGWVYQGGIWYYFKSSGAMVTGSMAIGGKTYRFNASGACLNP